MKNISNAYLVLSVADIRELLHAAELEQQVRGDDSETITIVLDNITVLCEGEEFPQITCWSILEAANASATQSEADLETRNASDMAQAVRDLLK